MRPVFLLFLILVMIVFINLTALAQVRFVDGFVVDLKGDTSRGGIEAFDSFRNPPEIRFREAQSMNVITLNPTQIQSFRIAKDEYFSAYVQVENSSRNLQNLDFDPALDLTTEAVFLKCIEHGPKSLYLYINQMDIPNYYIGNDSAFQLLPYKMYMKVIGNEYVVSENKSYIGVLMLYFADYPELKKRIGNTAYELNSLRNLYTVFYNEDTVTPALETKKDNSKWEKGFRAGPVITKIRFHSDISAYKALSSANFNTSTGLAVGFYLKYNFLKWCSFNSEVFGSTMNLKGSYSDDNPSYEYSNYSYQFKNTYFKWVNLFAYNYKSGDYSFSISAGMSKSWALIEYDNEVHEYRKDGVSHSKSRDPIIYTNHVETGFVYGIGASYKKFTMQARMEHGNGIASSEYLRSPTTSYILLFGYIID